MRWWLLALAVGCAQPLVHPPLGYYPSCEQIVEHTYGLEHANDVGTGAIDGRRDFMTDKPTLIAECESAHLTRRQRRCLATAPSTDAANACTY